MPYESLTRGPNVALMAARRFVDEAGCDAVKLEAGPGDDALVAALHRAGLPAIAHLGLRPQQVLTPDGYRAQARDAESIAELVAQARRMCDAGAVLLLLEAVPPEASAAVVESVAVPVIGCGAGPACDGHVVVTQDLLGMGTLRPPRFVPVYAQVGEIMQAAMERWVEAIASGAYPGAEHAYGMRSAGGTQRS
jgi:3-methyl-2-oxobutanoate hydroxymethyltransferase